MPANQAEVQRAAPLASPGAQAVDPPSLNDVLTTRNAAAYVGQSPSTLNKLRCTGRGPEFYRLGRAVRYRRRALDAWLEEHVARSTSEPPSTPAPSPAVALTDPALRAAMLRLLRETLPDLVREMVRAEAVQAGLGRSVPAPSTAPTRRHANPRQVIDTGDDRVHGRAAARGPPPDEPS